MSVEEESRTPGRLGGVSTADRVVFVPDAGSEMGYPGVVPVDSPGAVFERADRRPWIVSAILGVGVALLAVALMMALTRDPVVVTPTPTVGLLVVPAAAGLPSGAFATVPATVTVAGNQDLLSIARTGSTALVGFLGAPVTAEGTEVARVFGANAFSIRSATGAEMLVYVADVESTTLLNIRPGDRVIFSGTLLPASDLSGLVNTDAAALAGQTDRYILVSAGAIRIV